MSISLFSDGSHRVDTSQLSKYTAVFGSLFSGFSIKINNKLISVPIRFGNGNSRNKADTQLNVDEQLQPKAKPALPAMAFTLGSIVKDGQRQTVDHATMRSRNLYFNNSTANSKSSMSPSPYNVDFHLTVRANNTTEALLIFEQIESAFAKGVNVRLMDSDLLDVERVINIRKQPNLDIQDNFENVDETRIVEFELVFTLKGYLYNQINDVPVILEFDASLFSKENAWVTDHVNTDELEIRSLKQALAENKDE